MARGLIVRSLSRIVVASATVALSAVVVATAAGATTPKLKSPPSGSALNNAGSIAPSPSGCSTSSSNATFTFAPGLVGTIDPASSVTLPSGAQDYLYVGAGDGAQQMQAVSWSRDLDVTANYSGHRAISIGRSFARTGSFAPTAPSDVAVAGIAVSGYRVARVQPYSSKSNGTTMQIGFSSTPGSLTLVVVGGEGAGLYHAGGTKLTTLLDATYSECGSKRIASAAAFGAFLPGGNHTVTINGSTFPSNPGTAIGAVVYQLASSPGAPRVIDAAALADSSSLTLQSGSTGYVFGFANATHGSANALARGNLLVARASNGTQVAGVAETTAASDSFTTSAAHSSIVGAAVSQFASVSAATATSKGKSALSATVNVKVKTSNSLVLVEALGATSQCASISTNLAYPQEAAAVPGEAALIEGAYASAGSYSVTAKTSQCSGPSLPADAADLLAVFVFTPIVAPVSIHVATAASEPLPIGGVTLSSLVLTASGKATPVIDLTVSISGPATGLAVDSPNGTATSALPQLGTYQVGSVPLRLTSPATLPVGTYTLSFTAISGKAVAHATKKVVVEKVVGLSTSLSLANVGVASSGGSSSNCAQTPVLSSTCFSIQQLAQVHVPSESGAFTYTVRNVLLVYRLATGSWRAYGTYDVYDPSSATPIACRGTPNPSVAEGCVYSPSPAVGSTALKLPSASSITMSMSLIGGCVQFDSSETTPQSFCPSGGQASLTGAFFGTAHTAPGIETALSEAAQPQLVMVGFQGGEHAAFTAGSGTLSLASTVQVAGGSKSVAPNSLEAPVCTAANASSESSTGLRWVTASGSFTSWAHGGTGTPALGVSWVPAQVKGVTGCH